MGLALNPHRASSQALSRLPLGLEHFVFTMKGLGVSVLTSISCLTKRLYSEERKTHIPPGDPKPTYKRTEVCAHRLPLGPSLMLTERMLHQKNQYRSLSLPTAELGENCDDLFRTPWRWQPPALHACPPWPDSCPLLWACNTKKPVAAWVTEHPHSCLLCVMPFL